MTESGSASLEKVDHIVVLMLQNRSFDQMLGYLSLEGGRGDIAGLRAQFSNAHNGHAYSVYHLDTTVIADDPDHSAAAVDLQLGDGAMNGFVASFAKTLSDRGRRSADVGRVMGYYNGADLPVYDHLASEFTSAIDGSARSRVRRGPTACTRFAVARREAAMTCRSTYRRSTIARRSSDISTPTASPGGGMPHRSRYS